MNKRSWYDRVLVIDRSVWRCGTYGQHKHAGLKVSATKMLDNNGFMCCLGQACRAAGAKDKHQLHKWNPVGVAKQMIKDGITINAEHPIAYLIKLEESIEKESDFSFNAISINDDEKLSRSGRELSLYMLGRKHRIFVKFTGSYTDGWRS